MNNPDIIWMCDPYRKGIAYPFTVYAQGAQRVLPDAPIVRELMASWTSPGSFAPFFFVAPLPDDFDTSKVINMDYFQDMWYPVGQVGPV